ncbi:hypothetical protein JXA47_11210, partial [Candidatus Sumerlaeota bacterium]|nr:hypothetical protein [Candidatus Sumerlaeota bacterium]
MPADVRTVLHRLAVTLPEPQSRLAAALLGGLESLPSPTAPPPQTQGAQIISLHEGENASAGEKEVAAPIDHLMQAVRDEESTPQEVGLLWLEHFLGRPADERLPVLDRLMAEAPSRCCPVLRLEWHWGDLAGDRRLLDLGQRHFSDFPTPWMAFPREEGSHPVVSAAPPYEELEAWVASADGTGNLALVLSHEVTPGRHTFAVLMLDLWVCGIEDVWGNARVDSSSLVRVLSHFASLEPEVHWRRIRADHAAGLIQRAHQINEMRCLIVPPELWIWCDLFSTPADPPAALRDLRSRPDR